MKKSLLSLAGAIASFGVLQAQTVATFENLNLADSSFWNGSDFSEKFTSGNALFRNVFDTSFGDFWTGFAASTMRDTVTNSFTNQYSVISAFGYNGSKTYALAYSKGKIVLTGNAAGKQVSGFYVNNGTYPVKDMQNGSGFSKKFGGPSGNDSDFFKIIISGWKPGGNPADTALEFFLADYRNPDNSKDYILKDWTWVDLRAMKDLDSLEITFASSDVGDFGMNTPAYVFIDNFTTLDASTPTALTENEALSRTLVYPNPANEQVIVYAELPWKKYALTAINGSQVKTGSESVINISDLPQGIYFLTIFGESAKFTTKLLKY